MKYRVQRKQSEQLPPQKWLSIEAESMEGAAWSFFERLAKRVKLEQLPIEIHVADLKMVWPNGAPFKTHGYTFGIASETAKGE